MAEPRCCFGCWVGLTQGTTYKMGSRCPCGKGQYWEGRACPNMPNDILTWAKHKRLNWSRYSLKYGQFLGRLRPGMPNDTLPWAVQKWLNQSRCCLDYGLWWAQGSTWGDFELTIAVRIQTLGVGTLFPLIQKCLWERSSHTKNMYGNGIPMCSRSTTPLFICMIDWVGFSIPLHRL